jgi:hypothetical protein
MEIRFLLKGEKGAVQFLLYTGWLPESTAREYVHRFPEGTVPHYMAIPYDIGYHAYMPQYAGATPMDDACAELDGSPCYYDGSSSNAEHVYWALVTEGEETMWALLQERYDDLIGPRNILALPQGTRDGVGRRNP